MAGRRSGPLLWLFAGAIALRVALAAGGWAHPERLMTEDDSAEYVRLARNLSAGHGFSQAASPPYTPDVRRTPVYPSVVAVVFGVPGAGTRAAAIAGIAVSAATVLATYRLASLLLGPAAAWWAALLLAADLTSATYASQLLTEPLFTLLFVLSFVPLIEARAPAWRGAVTAGVLSGLTALCRPIAIVAAVALAPECRLRRSLRDAAWLLLAAAVVAAAFTGAWTLRNFRQSGTATVSSVAATNMYFHRAAYIEAWLQHRRVEDLRDEWERDFRVRSSSWSERERVRWMDEHGRDLVLAHPFVYALVAMRGAARMLTPDWIVLSSVMGGEHTPAFRAVYAVGWVQLAVVYVLAAIGVARLGRVSRLELAVLLAPIVYFLLIGGPEMYPRFRVPLMPFVSVLAACGITMERVA